LVIANKDPVLSLIFHVTMVSGDDRKNVQKAHL
jgi:hypothetical protein